MKKYTQLCKNTVHLHDKLYKISSVHPIIIKRQSQFYKVQFQITIYKNICTMMSTEHSFGNIKHYFSNCIDFHESFSNVTSVHDSEQL